MKLEDFFTDCTFLNFVTFFLNAPTDFYIDVWNVNFKTTTQKKKPTFLLISFQVKVQLFTRVKLLDRKLATMSYYTVQLIAKSIYVVGKLRI